MDNILVNIKNYNTSYGIVFKGSKKTLNSKL